jgi:hypothetical protein
MTRWRAKLWCTREKFRSKSVGIFCDTQLPYFESLCVMLLDYLLNLTFVCVRGSVSCICCAINWWGNIIHLKQLMDMQWNMTARAKIKYVPYFQCPLCTCHKQKDTWHCLQSHCSVIVLFMTVHWYAVHIIKPTNALMLKLYFYTQSVRTMTIFNLSWPSSGSYLSFINHYIKTLFHY